MTQNSMPKIVVLASGNGSNFQAIAQATGCGKINARIVAVISDVPSAQVLNRAKDSGIQTEVVDFSDFDQRTAFDKALQERVAHYNPDLIVLAGYMRILDTDFVNQWSSRLINIHPSLLPSYRGLHTHRRVLEDGVPHHGATVHFVVPELDSGPIIIQAQLRVRPDDDEETLARRVLAMEHIIYPRALDWFIEQRLTVVGNDVLLDGMQSPHQRLVEGDMAG